jgi:hypothetical protein
LKELPFIPLSILVHHNSPTVGQPVLGLTLVNGTVWTVDCLNVSLGTFGLLAGLLEHAWLKRRLNVFFGHFFIVY